MTRWIWIGAAALAAIGTSASARTAPAEPAAQIELSADGTTLYYAGSIDVAGYGALQKLLASAPRASELVIASPGGEVLAGRLMASMVNRRHLAVHVEHLCASACTLVLMASRDRSIGPAGRVGFHQSYTISASPKSKPGAAPASKIAGTRSGSGDRDAFGDDVARRLLLDAGVDKAFIERALSTPSEDMWYPDPDELLRAGVVTRRTDTLRAEGPKWGVDHATAATGLTGPFWLALATHRPDLWAEIGDDLWRYRNIGLTADAAYREVRQVAVDAVTPDIARAPDAIVVRLLDAHAAAARASRVDGYRLCDAEYVASPEGAAIDAAFGAEEEAVLADLLAVTKWSKPMSEAKAARLVFRELPQQAIGGKSPFYSDGFAECRDGLRIIEEIASRPEKLRTQLYRAIFTFY